MGWAKYDEDNREAMEERWAMRSAYSTLPVRHGEYRRQNPGPDEYLRSKATTIRVNYKCVAPLMARG